MRLRKRKAAKPAPPAPLVKPFQHPLRWIVQTVVMLALAVLLVKVGTWIIVSVYYLGVGANGQSVGPPFFGYTAPLRGPWHSLIPDDYTRHICRNVAEGLLGGALAQMIVFNRYKVKNIDKPGLLDRIEIALHIPNVRDKRDDVRFWQLILFPALVLLYAIPGLWLGFTVMHWVHALLLTFSPGTTFGSEVDQKVIGLFASFIMARRVIRGMADNVQGHFAARRKILNKPCRPYHPWNFRARVNGLTTVTAQRRYDMAANWVNYMLVGGILVGLALAGLGWYILNVIAK